MTDSPAAAPVTIDVAGPWFEDFTRDQEFDAPAVTLTAGHAALYQSWFADRLRLPLDHAAALAVTGADQPLVHPMLAINVAIGQSTWASQRVKANLFYRGLVMRRPVHFGDTLYTRTRIVGLRHNRVQPGRPATGVVALEMRTTNQRDEEVLHFWRCPMIPCRTAEPTQLERDDLDRIGAGVTPEALRDAVPARWRVQPVTNGWSGLRADALVAGTRFRIDARDTITSAPELVRLTLNMAMAHTDAKLSYLGDRLVYGGHTISMAFAQITRALPNILTLVAWESCDHTAPVVENDRIRTEVTVLDVTPLARGSLVRLHAECFAARGDPETESRVLDWKLVVWTL